MSKYIKDYQVDKYSDDNIDRIKKGKTKVKKFKDSTDLKRRKKSIKKLEDEI